MSNAWRPDLRVNEIRLSVDSQLAFFVIEGLRGQATEIREEIADHETTCGDTSSWCKIRYQALIDEYGDMETAVKETGAVLYDCMEGLADLHTTLGKILYMIHQMDLLLKNPEAVGNDPDMTDWRPIDKLAELKKEAAHREVAAKEDTGLMEPIDENTSILGLTEKLPKEAKVK